MGEAKSALWHAAFKMRSPEARSEYLPNGIMCSLNPGEVLILAEGEFWITRDWEVQPYCEVPHL